MLQHKILPLMEETWVSLPQLNTRLCKVGETGKLASWVAAFLASCFPIGPPLRRAMMGTACDCHALWSGLRFCGRNAELDLYLYSVVSSASCLPVLGGTCSPQNRSSISDTTDWREAMVCANLDAGWLQNNAPSSIYSCN